MSKKKKDHRARVMQRNLRLEQAALGDWDGIEEMLREKGYKDIDEAIAKEPELAPVLLPFALRAYKMCTSNLKKYGNQYI